MGDTNLQQVDSESILSDVGGSFFAQYMAPLYGTCKSRGRTVAERVCNLLNYKDKPCKSGAEERSGN